MSRFSRLSRFQLLLVAALSFAVLTVACGSDEGGVVAGGTDDYPKRIRTVETTTLYAEDDVKAIGFTGQKDFLLEYPGTSVAKRGFMNQTEVSLLIYASAEDAQTLGVIAAETQTFRRDGDGHAPDGDLTDRISCCDAASASENCEKISEWLSAS
ncbi:MAG: hypothetical protein V3T49_00140 [Dehalococcoidia bacterium]